MVAGLVLVLVAFLLILRAVGNNEPEDCSRPLRAGQWTAEHSDREPIAVHIQLCRLLRGKTQAQITTLMGSPDRRTANRWEYAVKPGRLDLGHLDLYFAGDRVGEVRSVDTGPPLP